MLSIIIPMRNEKQNIPLLVKNLELLFKTINQEDYELIFIDDYSTDGTLSLLKGFSQKNLRIKIIPKKPYKIGVGNSIKVGISYATGNLILTMDADLSHNPSDIPRLLKAMNKDTDLIIGSRYIAKSKFYMPDPRYVLSKLFNIFLKFIFRVSIYDITSGFRLIKKNKLLKLNIRSENFEVHPEINLKAAISRFKIREVPITFNRRRLGKSKLKYHSMLLKYIRLIYKLILEK